MSLALHRFIKLDRARQGTVIGQRQRRSYLARFDTRHQFVDLCQTVEQTMMSVIVQMHKITGA